MAVRIARQPNKIALIGAPTSAGARDPGSERAPGALRAAGFVARLQAAGYEVTDLGDGEPQLYQPDEENPRARNVGPVLAALEALKPRVEQATKSGALPVILGGDCTIALATLAAVRRYFRTVSLLYCDRDADLNVPATTPSGCFDGMVIAHIIGRGAAELVRFWGEPPLVREPDIALFGLERLDPPEEEFLQHSPIRRYMAAEITRQGPRAAAVAALEGTHGDTREFVLHLDVDAIASEDFSAADLPGSGGLRLDEVRQALEVFACRRNLVALEVTAYNPERDPDGSAVKLLVDLLASVLAARLAALTAPAPIDSGPAVAGAPPATEAAPAASVAETTAAEPTAAPAEASATVPPCGTPVGEISRAEEAPVEAPPQTTEPAAAETSAESEPAASKTPAEESEGASS